MAGRAALILFVVAVATLGGPARAEPPPGHPSPERAMDLLAPKKVPAASELPHQGKVLEAIHANDYTYLEVATDGGRRWLAAPRMEVRTGATIRYEDGATMTNFYSKLLQRTFASLMFVGHVAVLAD